MASDEKEKRLAWHELWDIEIGPKASHAFADAIKAEEFVGLDAALEAACHVVFLAGWEIGEAYAKEPEEPEE